MATAGFFLASAYSPAAEPIRLVPGYNTAAGERALQSLRTGVWNTAVGAWTLLSDTTGACNAAYGNNAMRLSTTGMDNAAFGVQALASLANGSTNVAVGYGAGINLTSGDKNIYVGSPGISTESSTIRIGGANHTRTFVSGIYGVTATGGTAVYINSFGQLGTAPSSLRFKENIEPMDNASKIIQALRPVTFKYKSDPTATPHFGLVAEEVEKVCPDLVTRDAEGKAFGVRYESVNAMLLNEFLKEHRKVQEQQATITELKSMARAQQKVMAALARRLDEQDSKIERVSPQMQATKPTQQIAFKTQ